eukprot:2002158-Karenia_brevis.AAC.1
MKRYEAEGRIQQEESKVPAVVLTQANACAVQLPTLVQDALRRHFKKKRGWDIIDGTKADMTDRNNIKTIINHIHNTRCGNNMHKGRYKPSGVVGVSIGLLCKSWSGARRNDGRGPGPLRDDGEFLMGLPNLSKTDQEKVDV